MNIKGHQFDALLESMPIHDLDANLLCRTAISDITDRKRVEAVSQEARRYAENIIETIREPFVILDKDLKILSANHSFYSTFEVTPDATVGNLIYDIGNRQWDIPSLRTLLEEILPKNTQFLNYEVSHTFQTIGQKIMLLNARQIYQEVIGTPIILLAIEDITERKRAEKVSQEARKYAENIIDTVREPFVALDKDLNVLSANRSFYSTFEVTPDETVGNLIYDIGDRQWDIPSLRTLLEEILPKNTQFLNYEVSHTFQTIGQKIMLLNARQIYQEVIGTPIILL
ncbi:MAG TPA: PAS domain S-box protein, partial [Candidatus Methanoperedens sp.]